MKQPDADTQLIIDNLIKAAPDMLEALRVILDNAWEDELENAYTVPMYAIELAFSAVAKATGHQN